MKHRAVLFLAAAGLLVAGQVIGQGPKEPPKKGEKAPADRPLTPEQVNFFEKHIRPVLADRCFKCHSADAEKLRGKLLLDTREGLLKGGESGPVVVPGKPGSSLLLKALKHAGDLKMPPREKLPDQVVADF